MGFVVDKAALGQVSSEYFYFPTVIIIYHPGLAQQAKVASVIVDLVPLQCVSHMAGVLYCTHTCAQLIVMFVLRCSQYSVQWQCGWSIWKNDLIEVLFRNTCGGTEEIHQHLSYDNRRPSRDSNRSPHEYKSRALPVLGPFVLKLEFRLSLRHTQTEAYSWRAAGVSTRPQGI
jgi:hypothetical protein